MRCIARPAAFSNASLHERSRNHLRSTSVLSDASGEKVAGSDVLHAPFGEIRDGTLSEPTGFDPMRSIDHRCLAAPPRSITQRRATCAGLHPAGD
jgi:hypothetical protein